MCRARRRVDVAVVHVRAGRARSPDKFLGAVDQRRGRQLDDVTRMREGRSPGGGRQLRHGEVLGRIDTRGVADEDADADRAGGEVSRELLEDPGHFRFGRGPLPCGPDQTAEERGGAPVERPVSDHVHARRRPRRREAVVDRRSSLRFLRVRPLHWGAAGFQVERRGDPVAGLQATARQRLGVAVEVDEAGGDDEPGDVDRRRTDETLPDRRYGAAVDPHVAHAVEPRLGIDDPTAGQHHVVCHEPTSSDRSPRRLGK